MVPHKKTAPTIDSLKLHYKKYNAKITQTSNAAKAVIVRLPKQNRIHFYQIDNMGELVFSSEGFYDKNSPWYIKESTTQMKSFSSYITENKLATNFEAFIVCGYNGGPKKDPDVLEVNRISVEEYMKYETETMSIVKAIKSKVKPKGRAEHYGSGAGKMISWWNGRSTPKTDIYIGNERFSLKEAGGSQLMSAKKGEAVSTFQAAMAYMNNVPSAAEKLAKRVASTMQEVVVPPSTTIGDFTKKVRAGQKVAKSLEPLANKFISRDKAKGVLTSEINKFFNESIEFRDWFVFEAATGFTKFSPEGKNGKPIANWVLKFDTSGNVHELEPLMTKKYQPTAYTRKMAEKVKFRVSWKTPTSKGKKTFLSLRGDILKEETYPEHIPTLCDILESARINFENEFGFIVEESSNQLNENVITKIGSYFKSLYQKIANAIMTIAKQGITALMTFLGLEVSDVSVSGLEI